METARLTDPAFWTDAAPCCAGGGNPFQGWEHTQEELEKHVMFQTSGSTGAPKWVALSKDALLVSAAAVNSHLQVRDSSCWGLALPVHHVGGFGVVARAFEAGCRLSVFGRRWDARMFTSWLEAERVSHVSLVPTQVVDLTRSGLHAPGSLRAVVVGGGRLEEVFGREARALGWPVLASYGMTEAGSQIATQDMDATGSQYLAAPIPLLPVWRAECGTDSRLRIAGPALFSGIVASGPDGWCYHKRSGIWHETPDLARLDGDMLTPIGRADSLVKILGELVDPLEVERGLADAAGTALTPGAFAVAALPDMRAEHVLIPVFAKIIGVETGANAVARYNKRVPGFRRVGEPVWIDNLPVTELGKVRRAELAAILSRPDHDPD